DEVRAGRRHLGHDFGFQVGDRAIDRGESRLHLGVLGRTASAQGETDSENKAPDHVSLSLTILGTSGLSAIAPTLPLALSLMTTLATSGRWRTASIRLLILLSNHDHAAT